MGPAGDGGKRREPDRPDRDRPAVIANLGPTRRLSGEAGFRVVGISRCGARRSRTPAALRGTGVGWVGFTGCPASSDMGDTWRAGTGPGSGPGADLGRACASSTPG